MPAGHAEYLGDDQPVMDPADDSSWEFWNFLQS
jgi:hypothetical protein